MQFHKKGDAPHPGSGLESGCDQHNGLKQALQPGQQLEASSARLCDKHWQDFQEATRDELGQVKKLHMAGRSLLVLQLLRLTFANKWNDPQ